MTLDKCIGHRPSDWDVNWMSPVRCPNTLSLVSFAGMTLDKWIGHRPSDWDVNWMSPVQGKSPPVQVKEPNGNLDMVTCRLSSCTKYTYG